jgi:hypothetical protein
VEPSREQVLCPSSRKQYYCHLRIRCKYHGRQKGAAEATPFLDEAASLRLAFLGRPQMRAVRVDSPPCPSLPHEGTERFVLVPTGERTYLSLTSRDCSVEALGLKRAAGRPTRRGTSPSAQ